MTEENNEMIFTLEVLGENWKFSWQDKPEGGYILSDFGEGFRKGTSDDVWQGKKLYPCGKSEGLLGTELFTRTRDKVKEMAIVWAKDHEVQVG